MARTKGNKSENNQKRSGIPRKSKKMTERKPHRFRPGTVALREIKKF